MTRGFERSQMILLDILAFPDPRLRTKAKPVKNVNGKLARFADRMLATLYAAPGIGLAASQINFHQRLIVIDVSAAKNQPLILINPVIIDAHGETLSDEGCLSVPGFYETVKRHAEIHLQAINREGEAIDMTASKLLAICIQHEIDHLEGKLFVDYLSKTKRLMIRKKLLKIQKQNRPS